eukprot:m.420391 g.420391  ORF g.420391 m.420391 type:complete len:210 (+) comp32465_c0_seq1:21-650(+)
MMFTMLLFPSLALGRGGCPEPLSLQDPAVAERFNLTSFAGHYFELQLHDVTQVHNLCGCQTSNKSIVTRNGNVVIDDDFLMLCPGPHVEPGGEIYPSALSFNLTANPGVLHGHWPVLPSQLFPDTVVAVGWPDLDGNPYRWLLEFQCVEKAGLIVFVGVNFYSRWTTSDPRGVTANEEMAAAAAKWGVYNYTKGPGGFTTVNHTGCPQM